MLRYFNRKLYNKQIVYYCMFPKVSESVLKAIETSVNGVAELDVLKSLKLCDDFTLKTTINRLNKGGRIIRLKRGVYSANPMKDAFVCAQFTFNGYLGFSSALYLHKLITEVPFTIFVVTTEKSGTKKIGGYEFKAVSLKEKAVGVQTIGAYWISSRTKTLFDCLYLPQYGVGEEKLIAAYKEAKLSKAEWREFESYVKKFTDLDKKRRMFEIEKKIRAK